MNELNQNSAGGTSSSGLVSIRKNVLWIALFATAMGLLEAICVVYLRQLINPAGIELSHAPTVFHGTRIEHVRELCTMIMLFTVAWLAGINGRTRAAYFFLMFGIWDIIYYAGLKWFVNWPSSLIEWDCLFLIPKAWHGPVLAPVLISVYLIFACTLLLLREHANAPLRISFPVLGLTLLGFLVWYGSFVKDTDRIQTHGYVKVDYSWLLFALGMVLCLIGVAMAFLQSKRFNPRDIS